MKKISKLKWNWIKFWGYRYVVVFPNKDNKEYISYHHRYFDKRLWDNFFEEYLFSNMPNEYVEKIKEYNQKIDI